LSYIYRVENENEIIKWLNGEVKIEDLKQSEGFGTLEKIAHYASHLKGRCARFKISFEKREKKSTNFNKTFLVAVLAVLLTSSYFLFSTTQSYETGIAQTKTFRLPDNSSFIECRVKITFK
jgi:ferric-dicitrate binding protein FerR (iron transport regulator)